MQIAPLKYGPEKENVSLLDLQNKVSAGWAGIVERLVNDLFAMGWNGEVLQVKEKFGGLRFYLDNPTDALWQRTAQANIESQNTCPECGALGRPSAHGTRVFCSRCEDKEIEKCWLASQETQPEPATENTEENLDERFSKKIPIGASNSSPGRWTRHVKARHRIQRAFHDWYLVNQPRFLIKLDFIRCFSHRLVFGFAGLPPMIVVQLVRNEITVYVVRTEEKRREEYIDMLVWYDSGPQRVRGGYICTECDPQTRKTLPSRAAVWEGDLFETFLGWVNEVLAISSTLHIFGSHDFENAMLLLKNGREARMGMKDVLS